MGDSQHFFHRCQTLHDFFHAVHSKRKHAIFKSYSLDFIGVVSFEHYMFKIIINDHDLKYCHSSHIPSIEAFWASVPCRPSSISTHPPKYREPCKGGSYSDSFLQCSHSIRTRRWAITALTASNEKRFYTDIHKSCYGAG